MVAISWSGRCSVVVVKPSALRTRSFRLSPALIVPWMLPPALQSRQARVLLLVHRSVDQYAVASGSLGSHLEVQAAAEVALHHRRRG